MTLYRPVGIEELRLIAQSGYKAFPPRLSDQPICYPVLNFEYAERIAQGWNANYNSIPCGFVTKFEVDDDYVRRFKVETVGGRIHQELWVPAAELQDFNRHIIGCIIGCIRVEASYYGEGFTESIDPETNLPFSIR